MAYTNRTTFYRIPVMAYGDQMSEEQEMIKMGIIDSLLYASCFGCMKAIFEEGTYSIQFTEGNTSAELVISPITSGGYSLMGLVNGRMFYSHEAIRAGQLMTNMTYYAYAEYTGFLEYDPSQIQIRLYTEPQANSSYKLPLCIVNTSTASPSINTDVDKPYAKNILAHIIDVTNPHGKTLYQQNLNVTDSLTVQGNPVHGAIYGNYTTHSGEHEWTPPDGQVPVFASAYPESSSAGTISWRIASGKVYLSNSGVSGITVNFKIETEKA